LYIVQSWHPLHQQHLHPFFFKKNYVLSLQQQLRLWHSTNIMLLNNVVKSNSAELPFLLLPVAHEWWKHKIFTNQCQCETHSMIKKKVSLNLIAVYQYFNKQWQKAFSPCMIFINLFLDMPLSYQTIIMNSWCLPKFLCCLACVVCKLSCKIRSNPHLEKFRQHCGELHQIHLST